MYIISLSFLLEGNSLSHKNYIGLNVNTESHRSKTPHFRTPTCRSDALQWNAHFPPSILSFLGEGPTVLSDGGKRHGTERAAFPSLSAHRSAASRACTLPCSLHRIHPKRTPCAHPALIPFLLPPPPGPSSHYSAVFMNLVTVGTSHKYNHVISVLLCPACFISICLQGSFAFQRQNLTP